MGLRVVYESGISGQTEEIQQDRLRLYGFDVTEHAEEGSVALSSITIDDPDGDLDVVGWRRIWCYEDTATGSNSLIYHAWIGDKRVTRGPYPTEAGRIWTISAADQNVTLGFRILSSAGSDRPSETDVARVNWLTGVVDSFGRAPITDTTFVFGAGAVLMDAADYRGQTPLDVLNDCAQQSGKNYFVYTRDNGYPASQPTRGLWYGSSAHNAYDSSIRLSNVAADVDNVLTFAIGDDTELVRDPARVYSGAYVQYQGGAIYEQVASIYNQFTQRDATVSAPNVRTAGAATRRAQRYLADLATEEDRITTSFYVPAATVNFVKPGMRIWFRATHLPQYESFVQLRVLSRGVAEVSELESVEPKYKVTLVLTSDTIPAQPVVTAAITNEISATLTIGSGIHIGEPGRDQHWASQVGEALPALVIGRQYRLHATVIDCLTLPGPPVTYDSMSATLSSIHPSAATTALVAGGPYVWTPGSGTQTDMLNYDSGGITWSIRDPIASGGTAPDNSYRPGQIIVGDWCRFDGPAVAAADISISGAVLSGFYGYKWVVNLKLQSRAVP